MSSDVQPPPVETVVEMIERHEEEARAILRRRSAGEEKPVEVERVRATMTAPAIPPEQIKTYTEAWGW